MMEIYILCVYFRINLVICEPEIYTIYAYCRKIYSLFMQVLETGRKESQLFWSVYQNTNKFLFYQQFILCLSCNIKNSKVTAIFY